MGSVLNGLLLRPKSPKYAGVMASFFSASAFVVAIFLCVYLISTKTPIHLTYEWFKTANLSLSFGFYFDALSAWMVLIITGIGTLIHVYSIGYMAFEPTPSRYFAYLNLFLFNMLVLVTADNLLVLFVGWEGVGLCSYLLIGYWYQDIHKANAGIKAFVVNRIGDAGFLVGIFICFKLFGTLDFDKLYPKLLSFASTSANPAMLDPMTLLFWMGV